MSQLLQTDDGDLDISSNNFEVVEDSVEIRQRVIQNLRTFLGEWFLNLEIGVPYFEIVFDKKSSPSLVRSVFVDEILNTVGVVELTKFADLDLDGSSRELSVDFEYIDLSSVDEQTIEVSVP